MLISGAELPTRSRMAAILSAAILLTAAVCAQQSTNPVVLHAARVLNVADGTVLSPGEVLVQGERIVAAGRQVPHPSNARVIDLGDTTLMPGLIDAHVHLFLHPGAEDLQTVEESVAWRVILA